MLNRSASLAMSTSVLKALPGKLDIKRHSPSILYLYTGDSQVAVFFKGQLEDMSCKKYYICRIHNIPI